jgi:hypothetical protein
MPKITARALLNVGVELTINEPARTFTLNSAGNLIPKDGVTLQALYSKFSDLWATLEYQDSPFPMTALDALSGQYYFGVDEGGNYNGWKPANDATRQMLRDGGWREYSSAGVLNREYVGVVGLGSVSAGAQLYYQLAASDAPANFTFTDQCNQGVQVFGDAANGNFDKRTFLTGFCREYGKKYKTAPMAETGKTETGAYIVNLLLSNDDDLKIAATDTAMTGAPYSGITVSYYTANQSRNIGGTNYNFKTIINGNGATLEQIYTKIQFLLRQSANINTAGTAGVITGKTAAALLAFSGDTLVTSRSVFIDNVNAADSNRVEFFDDGNVKRTNPYTAAGVMEFNSALVGAGSSYRLMYAAPPGAGNDYGEAGAITVKNASNADITGSISSGSIGFDFDYDNSTAGGAAGTDKNVVLIGIRPGFGKFAMATGTLTRSKTIKLSLVAATDRVYS